MIAELHGRRETVEHPLGSEFRLFINREAENYPPHWHTDLEVIMPLENSYTAIVDKKKYVLEPNDILIIPSGEMHELIAPSEGKRLIFQIDHSILREVNGFDSIYSKFFPCAVFKDDGSTKEHGELVDLLQRVLNEFETGSPLYEACIHSLVIYFFVLVGRIQFNQVENFTGVKKQKQQSYIDIFFNLCTYMNEHCTEDLSLEELADMSGFSKSHFIRLFKEFAGVSYYEYLTKRRMIFAEILLLDNPELSISDIAMQSGFNSLATFNRVFKTTHACTPTDYRKRFNASAS